MGFTPTCEVTGPAGRIVINRSDLPRYQADGYVLAEEEAAPESEAPAEAESTEDESTEDEGLSDGAREALGL